MKYDEKKWSHILCPIQEDGPSPMLECQGTLAALIVFSAGMVKISNKKLKFKGQEIVKEILRIF
jgi:hypothetical protein